MLVRCFRLFFFKEFS